MLRVFLRILATLVAFAAHGCCSSPLPSLSIPRCNVGAPAALDGLSRSDGSAPFPAGTSISLCWTPDSLVLEYHCLDDRFLRNDFLECNSPMYNQEVVEAFVAPRGSQDPQRYLEVETTPHSALYSSHIFNPFLNGTISHTLVDCNTSGIEHFSSADESSRSWRAVLAIPWRLVNAAAPSTAAAAPSTAAAAPSAAAAPAQRGDEYRANFYRINMRNNVSSCSASDCDYGAWSATMRSPPSFHQPKYFGVLVLA